MGQVQFLIESNEFILKSVILYVFKTVTNIYTLQIYVYIHRMFLWEAKDEEECHTIALEGNIISAIVWRQMFCFSFDQVDYFVLRWKSTSTNSWTNA